MHRHVRTLLRSALAAATLAGCTTGQVAPPPVDTTASLARFEDCEDLRTYVTASYVEQLVRMQYGGWGFMEDGAVAESDSSADAPSSSGGAAPRDFSETNNQEAGVDEADLVKTDGQYLYIAQSQGELTIVKSWPAAETAVLGRVEIAGNPMSLFLHGDRAIVFSQVYDDATVALGWGYGSTRMTVVDVSDRANPVALREIDVQGYMTSGRMIGSDVYVVLQTYAEMPQELYDLLWGSSSGTSPVVDLPEMDWSASEEEMELVRQEARELLYPHVQRIVAEMPTEKLLPKKMDRVADGAAEAEPLLDCGDVYHPEGQSYPSILSVAHIGFDDADGTEVSATGVMADGYTVYASENSLYVSQSSWWWWWGYGDLDLETHIHKFALAGADTVYEASGEVPGWLLNQFSMGEHNGYLRVATTDIDWWWGAGTDEETAEPANNVFVLESDGTTLNQVGELRGIAPSEQIYASRFIGDRGYLVTFRQIDPLFTLDLSDPTAPEIKGELKIPGYSSYLHPIGDTHLLAVGMDGTMDGQITGFAVSLFDVTDMSNPTEVDKLTVESDDWSYSQSLWDHHAFTFHRDVLSVPLYTYDWDDATGAYSGFSGLLAVKVDTAAGLAEAGRVDHEDLIAESRCLYDTYGYEDGGTVSSGDSGDSAPSAGDEMPDDYDPCAESFWYAQMKRSVAIENFVYSISDYGIKVNDAENPSTQVAKVLFWPVSTAR
jgi:uncharacterized secreted protein with C-terminal beta-propeller domain